VNGNEPDREKWRRHFGGIIVSGDPAEVDAATEAAIAAIRRGAGDAAAKTAGKQAAMRYRNAAAGPPAASPFVTDQSRVQTAERPAWPAALAARLFAIPARWGWEPAALPAVAESPPPSAPGPAPRGWSRRARTPGNWSGPGARR
jgi:hypothetical protein